MEKFKILIVDDEIRMRKLVRDFLIKNNYNVIEAENGIEALEIFEKEKTDLVILDVMMPKMDGWEVCTKIREKSNVPIMMLTAKAEEYDELKGFSLGINEYITKPFSPKILVARVENIFKKFENISVSNIIEEVGIEMNFDSHKVKVDGMDIELSIKEFELLEYFLKNKNMALSREAILTDVWKYDYFGDARTIDTHVKKLRQKIGNKGDYIKTIWGLGYKFEV